MSDQCALDESGGLKEAKDIEFFFSESETIPLASSASLQRNPGNTELRCGQQMKKIEKMQASIAAEQRSEYGGIIKKHRPGQRGQQSSRLAKKPKVDTASIDNVSDPDDSDFMSDGLLAESLELEDGDTEVDEVQPSNAEIADILPSKTIPTTGRGSGK